MKYCSCDVGPLRTFSTFEHSSLSTCRLELHLVNGSTVTFCIVHTLTRINKSVYKIVCTLLNVQTVLSLKWRLFLLPNYLFGHLYSRLSSVYISLSDNPRLSVKIKGPASFNYINWKKLRVNFWKIFKYLIKQNPTLIKSFNDWFKYFFNEMVHVY